MLGANSRFDTEPLGYDTRAKAPASRDNGSHTSLTLLSLSFSKKRPKCAEPDQETFGLEMLFLFKVHYFIVRIDNFRLRHLL